MANTYLESLSDAFQDRLVQGFRDVMLKNDPIAQNIIDTRRRVSRDPISKEYKVVFTLATSLAGGLEFSTVLGNPTTDLGTGARPVLNDSFDAYPGIKDSTMPGVSNYSVQLTRIRGNVIMPFAALQANQLTGVPLGDYPALIMKKHIELVGHIMACSFYVDTSAKLVKLNTSATAGNVTHVLGSHVVTVTCTAGEALLEEGRHRRLKPGMYVDIWKSDMSAAWNPNGFVIITKAINYAAKKFTITLFFENTDDADTYGGTGGAGSTNPDNTFLVPRGAILDKTASGTGASRMPCGYQSWAIVADGSAHTLYGSSFGNLDIDTMPELASIVGTSVGAVTETVLNEYLALARDGLDADLDTIITTNGILVNLLDYPLAMNMNQMQRQGQAADIRMGWKSLDYTFDGKVYQLYASPYMSTGEMVVMKTQGGNLKRHFPPTVPGFGTRPGLDAAVQWVGPMFGNSIWLPNVSNGRYTDGTQAPYHLMMQNTVDDPRSVRLTGCDETSLL